MIKLEESYKNYEKDIKSNKKTLLGIDNMLNSMNLLQFSILQCLALNQNVTVETFIKLGFDKDLSVMVFQELFKNNLVDVDKETNELSITELGKNILLALYFRSIEQLF